MNLKSNSWVANKEHFDDDWWEQGAPLNDKRVMERFWKHMSI